MREWPPDWQVMLAAIGGHYHFARADLDSLTADDVAFWLGAAAELMSRHKGVST